MDYPHNTPSPYFWGFFGGVITLKKHPCSIFWGILCELSIFHPFSIPFFWEEGGYCQALHISALLHILGVLYELCTTPHSEEQEVLYRQFVKSWRRAGCFVERLFYLPSPQIWRRGIVQRCVCGDCTFSLLQ